MSSSDYVIEKQLETKINIANFNTLNFKVKPNAKACLFFETKDGKAIIKKLKKKDLLDIALHVAKEHNFKLIDINFAQRGDVLYYKDEFDWDGTLGVCIGDKTMFNWKKGISLILNNQCKYCWRIE